MTWNDTVIEDGANGTELPKFDDANSTPVKMRMKKSNGNIVDADILTTFLLEKLDATTLNSLMSATSPVTLGLNDGKVVIGVDGSAIDAKAVMFNDNSSYIDIITALYNQECVYYFRSNGSDKTGAYIYAQCGYDDSAGIMFASGNRVLTIATDGSRTETIGQYAKVFTYGDTYESSDFENCFAICDYNGQYLYQNGTNQAFVGISDGNIVSTSWSESGWDSITTTPLSKENILIIGVNTTTYSIADLAKYDVVILNAGGVKHLLTELTSKKAVFSGTYLVGDMVVSRTYTYDGTNWTVNDAGSLYRVKVNANTEPQYLFNAIVEGNGISITGGDSNTMTVASKTMVLTWRQAYPIDDLLKQDVLVCDVEGERYQCASKTDTKLTFTRADSEGIKTTTYDGEVWSDIKTVDYPKSCNILVLNTSTGIATFDESLPTKVYVPDEGIFYDCTKYESISGTQYFTITKDYNIFTRWARVPGDWGFQGMTWNSLQYFIDDTPNVGNTYTLDNSALGKPVLLKYADTAPDITISIGGIVFRNAMKDSDIDWLLEAHTDDELTWRGRLSDNGTKLQFTVDEAIEDYTVEQFS